MDKTIQDLVWSVLPKEFKEEVKKLYTDALDASNSPHDPDDRKWGNYRVTLLEKLFGSHNLIADAEGEEMLTVPRSKVQELFNEYQELYGETKGKCHDKEVALSASRFYGKMCALSDLFGSKCLPDEACNVASSDVASSKSKPTEPKFNPGDKVLRKYHDYEDEELPYDIFEGYYGKDKQGYICGIESTRWLIRESDLELYTEPEESDRTKESCSSDHSVVKDEMVDSIIKDGFREHNRLHIAAMAMQGILNNIDLFKKVLETGKETLDGHGIPYRAVAKASFLFADALIAESEKGGES